MSYNTFHAVSDLKWYHLKSTLSSKMRGVCVMLRIDHEKTYLRTWTSVDVF